MSKPKTNSYDGKIAGLYDLEDTLGRGHFAVVKLARHVFTGEKVAVKVIDKTKLDEVSRAHLFQEVRCMKLVQHPNVVRLYEVIDTQTKLYLILELGDGGDLYDYIMKYEKGLDEGAAKKYFGQIVNAISYCHKLHVVHRDLKPENVVFFEKLGMVKLTDFGFSNKFCPGQKLETSCGSLAYSAPEILLGDSYDAPAVDVWSLGVILYMLVCGHAPFQEANDSETLTMIMDCKYTIPSHISDGCRRLIQKMLIRDPEKRANLEEIANDSWLCSGGSSVQPADYLPLVSREHLSEDDHQHIIQKLVNGGIATKEEILEALDKNSYDHITATYFLLAERKLRAHRQEQAQLLNEALSNKADLSALAISPRAPTNPSLPTHLCASNSATVESLLSPHDTNRLAPPTSPVMGHSMNSPQNCHFKGVRKCSIVEEEEEDGGSEKGETSGETKSASSPSLNRDMKLELCEVSGNGSRSSSSNSSPCHSPSRISGTSSPNSTSNSKYKTLPSPNRKLHSVRSSPQLTLNEIFEEGESDAESGSGIQPSPTQRIPLSRIIHSHQSVTSPAMLRKFEQRRQFTKARTASCSSSDASDDDSDPHKRKVKLKSIPRREDHDDSNDSQDRNGGGSGMSGGPPSNANNNSQLNQGSSGSQGGQSEGQSSNKGESSTGKKCNQGEMSQCKPTDLRTSDQKSNWVFCKSTSSPLNVITGAGHQLDLNLTSPVSETFSMEITKLSLSEPSSPILKLETGKENKLRTSLNFLNLSGKDRVAPGCNSHSRSPLGISRIIKQAPRFVSKRLDINQNGLKKKGRESKCNTTDLVLAQASSSKCCSLC